MTWRRWRRKVAESRQRVAAAEELRDQAERQQRRVEDLTPRVDAVASSLRRLRKDNHFGPMIDAILRGDG